jgi:hypothetical protein
MKRRLLLPFLAVLLGGACTKVYVPTQPSTTPTPTPVPAPVPVQRDTIQFLVTGNASGARIRYQDALDGLVQVTTGLPFVVNIQSVETSAFLSLDATPTGYPTGTYSPFLSVQILVNGVIFREASTADWQMGTVAVQGTFRR